MMIKVAVPNRFQLKTVSRFRTVLMPGQGEVHYIGGADILPPPLDAREEGKMIGMLGTEEDGKARSALIEHNLRLVAHVVKKYQGTGEDTDDLISIGTIGLIKAVNTFDVDKGSRLATYAARCVENEILMLLRAGKKRAKEVSLFEPIGTDKDGETVSLVDVIEMENPKTIDQLILDQDIKELYQAFDQKLTENEKQVISMRYGLFKGKEHTQREVAGVLGISRSYVSRIEKKAIGKLREEFEKIQ